MPMFSLRRAVLMATAKSLRTWFQSSIRPVEACNSRSSDAAPILVTKALGPGVLARCGSALATSSKSEMTFFGSAAGSTL